MGLHPCLALNKLNFTSYEFSHEARLWGDGEGAGLGWCAGAGGQLGPRELGSLVPSGCRAFMAVVEGKKSFLHHLLFMEAGGWEQAGGSTSLRPGPSLCCTGLRVQERRRNGRKKVFVVDLGGQCKHPYDVPFESPWRSSLSTQDKASVPFLPLLDARVPTNPEAAPTLIFRLRNLSLWEKIM